MPAIRRCPLCGGLPGAKRLARCRVCRERRCVHCLRDRVARGPRRAGVCVRCGIEGIAHSLDGPAVEQTQSVPAGLNPQAPREASG